MLDLKKLLAKILAQINSSSAPGMAGFVQMYAGSTAPTGWLFCDGKAVSRTTYAKLYAVIGTTYGSGDGSTTFNLPDFRGRMPVGVNNSSLPNGANSGLSTRNRNASGGSEYLQAHAHAFTDPTFNSSGSGTTNSQNTTTTGAGSSHSHGMSHTHSHNHGTNSSTYTRFILAKEGDGATISRRAIKNGTGTEYSGMVYSNDGLYRSGATDTDATASSKTSTDGESAHTHSYSHTHGTPNHKHTFATSGSVGGVQTTAHASMTTGTGGNMSPFRGINFIICTGKTS